MESARIRSRHSSGSAASAVLNPVNGVRDQMRRAGHKPRDHAMENVRKMREMQRRNRLAREMEADAPDRFKMNKFRNVPSKVATTRRRSAPTDSPTGEPAENRSPTSGRSGGSGGPDGSQPTKRFLRRGSGKMASKVTKLPERGARTSSFRREGTRKPAVPSSRDVAKLAPRSETNFVQHNRVENIRAQPPPTTRKEGSAKHESYGQVPRYLQERKVAEAEARAYMQSMAPDPDCPPGMTRMPDEERLATLAVLRESRSNVMSQMQRLPLKIETAGQIRRKNDMEAKLKEIEDAIKIFDKPKVFVQEDC